MPAVIAGYGIGGIRQWQQAQMEGMNLCRMKNTATCLVNGKHDQARRKALKENKVKAITVLELVTYELVNWRGHPVQISPAHNGHVS